jgi:uncharacterized protein YoxC
VADDDLAARVAKLEHELAELEELPQQVSELRGAISTLTQLVTKRFDHVDERMSWRAVLTVVVMPVVLAGLTGYFALRAAGL